MYPGQFDYYEATSVDEALDLLDEHADAETELLAGGHSLIPTMKTGLADPDVLIDLGGIDDIVGVDRSNGTTSIGAMTPYATIAADSDLRSEAAVVAEAAGAVGDIQVRNAGTIGGNLAHSDPASDLPAAILAADATIVMENRDGERSVPAGEFFLGMYETAIEGVELLTSVEIPHQSETDGSAYLKKPSPSSGYAMVGVAASIETDNGSIADARVAANGAFDHAVRLGEIEDALVGEAAESSLGEAAAEHALDGVDDRELMDDTHASGAFRGHLLEIYAGRSIATAIERAA